MKTNRLALGLALRGNQAHQPDRLNLVDHRRNSVLRVPQITKPFINSRFDQLREYDDGNI